MYGFKPAIVPTPGSSNLRAFAYDPYTFELFIQFHRGNVYTYPPAPESLYRGLKATLEDGGSVGRFFTAEIRRLPCRQLTDIEAHAVGFEPVEPPVEGDSDTTS